MSYKFHVKSCGVCPFFNLEHINKIQYCWLNDDNYNIEFNLEKLPNNCPLLDHKSVIIIAEEIDANS